jgi:hypothetical protein
MAWSGECVVVVLTAAFAASASARGFVSARCRAFEMGADVLPAGLCHARARYFLGAGWVKWETALSVHFHRGSKNPVVVGKSWSGRPGSNWGRPAWEAGILPLNYARLGIRLSDRDRFISTLNFMSAAICTSSLQ